MTARVAAENTRQKAAIGVSQNVANKPLAAVLLAESQMLPESERRLTDQDVADAAGVTRRTVLRWKQEPEFQAMMQDAEGKIIADALRLASAQKYKRIQVLHNLTQKILTSIDLREETYKATADTPENAARAIFGSDTPPWAATGLYIAKQKISASGKVVTDWELDVLSLREVRANFEHIARELGQWTEHSKVDMDAGVRIEVVGVADEDMP